MEGDLSDIQQHGVIPRSAAAIFDALKRDPDYVSSSVYCSLLEIYNEELSDLLVERSSKRGNSSSKSTTPKLAIMEGENGPFCRGLSESKVTTAEDLLALMQKAHQQRMTGETDMNKESSRSHCIFTLRVIAKRKLVDGSVLEVGGKLHCVDLAGSECAKACGNAGKQQAARERERMNINRSLLTLGRVVKLLKEKSEKASSSNSVRIPYRDSKLTRILQESLGGRCKTCLIATISPSVTAIEESMSTLNYAQAANGIINKPITTSLMSVGGLDNNSPKGDGVSGAGSIEHWHEMECRLEYMQSQVDEAQQALARKHIQHQEFVERAEKAELAQELAERKFEKATHDIAVLETKVEDVTHQLEESKKYLHETKIILSATQETEVALTEEATALINVLQTTIADGDSMHRALVEKRHEDIDRKAATKDYQRNQEELFLKLLDHFQEICELQKKKRTELEAKNSDHKALQLVKLDQQSAVVEEMKQDCISDIESIKTSLNDGVLPVFRTLTLSSKEKLDGLSTSLKEAETNLQSQCQLVLKRLEDNSTRIAELETSYDVSSNKILENMSAHLEETKQYLNETVVGITTALQKANENRQLQRNELQNSIGTMKDKFDSSIDQLESLSGSHAASIAQSIQTLTNEKVNRSSIVESISDLDRFSEQKKDEYIRNLERQLQNLSKQHHALVISNEKQQEMNKTLMSNVMSGVQTLLAKEMKAISDFQSINFKSFTESNDEMKMGVENIVEHTNDTFAHLRNGNKQLDSNIRNNFEGQEQLSEVLEKENSKFDTGMKSAMEVIRTPIEQFSQHSNNVLERFEAEDQDSTESIVHTSKKLLEDASNQLACDIHEGMKKGILDLQASNSEGLKYVREHVLQPVRLDIVENIQTTEAKMYASTQSELSVAQNEIEQGENAVIEELDKGLDFALEAEKRLEVASNLKFAATITEHREHIRESHWLENTLELEEEHITNQVKKSSALVSSSVECLGGFARDTILVEEETPEVDERNIPSYSKHLTSTDEPEVLLREAGLVGENEAHTKENDKNTTDTKVLQKESPLPKSSSTPLGDRSGNINTVNNETSDASPPLKRAADRTKSNLPNGSRKRYKTRLR